MIATPADIVSVEACATELEEVAADLRLCHTIETERDNWTGEEAAKADYDRLMALAKDARTMVARWKDQAPT